MPAEQIIDLLTVLPDPRAPDGEKLQLQRCWPRGDARLSLEFAHRGGERVAGQWFDDRARGEQVARTTPGACWLGRSGVVLQPGGADRRLPGLAALAREQGATLVVHRPERRAVVRRGSGTHVKLVRPEKAAALLAADRRARQTGAIEMPELIHADLDSGRLEWSTAPGRTIHELLRDRAVSIDRLREAGAAAGGAVRSLHRAAVPGGLGTHTPENELETAASWMRAAGRFASVPPAAYNQFTQARARLAEPPANFVLVHRDLHDKQILIDSDRVILLDVDTLARGEPACDIANFLVHLDLRVSQGVSTERAGAVAAGFLDAYRPCPSVLARLPAYACATRARLSGVYALRPAGAAST